MYLNVKYAMLRKGWTLHDLAEATGIKYQTLSRMLNGKAVLTLAHAIAIKNALESDLTLEELFSVQVAA